jgi:hypothetical protein
MGLSFKLETSNPFIQAYKNMYLEFTEKWPLPVETVEERIAQELAWKNYMESIL